VNDLLIQAAPRGTPLALYLDELERRVALLEDAMKPVEIDPLEVGTEVFRQTTKIKDRALKRRV
jgi:hypothetical protein